MKNKLITFAKGKLSVTGLLGLYLSGEIQNIPSVWNEGLTSDVNIGQVVFATATVWGIIRKTFREYKAIN